MAGVAILSLDCEGKWGVADHLDDSHAVGLTNERLRWAYEAVAQVLRDFEVSATFAVVELFTLSPAQQRQSPLGEFAATQPYLRAAVDAIAAGDEGWSAPWFVDLVGSGHEVGSHGFSHTPWQDLSTAQAAQEVELVAAERRGTFVFPRNRVAHVDVLERAGFLGYRAARPATSRLKSLLSEFNVATRADPRRTSEGFQAIPPGYFINWLGGPRRLVPRSITRARARSVLADAAANDRVAHFWTHPENIATHPATLENFRAVVAEMARMRDAGQIQVMTQLDYCRGQ